jgi:hypothetical protein
VASPVPFFRMARSSSATGGTGAVRSDGPFQRIIGLTGGRLALVLESAGTLRACSRGPGNVVNRPVPLAREIVLQVAVKDIGQLTDIANRRGASDARAVRPGRNPWCSCVPGAFL